MRNIYYCEICSSHITGIFDSIFDKYGVTKITINDMIYGEIKPKNLLLCQFVRFSISWLESQIDIGERAFHMFNILWSWQEFIAVNGCNTYVINVHNTVARPKTHSVYLIFMLNVV